MESGATSMNFFFFFYILKYGILVCIILDYEQGK